jgi:hypothetical protein
MIATTTPTEIRELTREELDAIQGGWVANAVGAGVGALSGGVTSYISSGGDWSTTAKGAAVGAVTGAINPVSSIGTAARAIGTGIVAGYAERGYDAARNAATR